ncbi:MAG: MBL fold metallo-hydrolase [Phycisphaerales bacterium]
MSAVPSIAPFVLGEFQTNCYVVSVPGRDECWIVDVGERPQRMLEHVERAGLRPVAIVLTHCHCDHIAGLDLARGRLGSIEVMAHEAERGFCGEPQLNLSAFVGAPVTAAEPTRWLHGGETLDLAGSTWRVMHTPGHSPGGITLVHDESKQAIVGDTLFAGSIGRIDFPTSDPARMERTLAELLRSLPDETRIHPGHGPSTTIGRERRTNPYLRELRAESD